MRKVLYTGAYLLTKGDCDNKGFGYVQGFAYYPDYTTMVKVYIKNEYISAESDIDDTHLFVLDENEFDSLSKATQCIQGRLEMLISLAKRNLLKDECYIDESEYEGIR